MRRRYKVGLGILVFLMIAVGGVAPALMRSAGHKHEPAQPVASEIFRVRNMIVDLYAARVADGAILFDTGVDASGGAMDAALAAAGTDRTHTRFVFLSHGHPDHLAAAPLLTQAAVFGGAADVTLMAGQKDRGTAVTRMLARVFQIPTVTLGHPLEGRQSIPVGAAGETVVALPFPGHTRGSYLYLFRGVLFVGDAFNYEAGRLTFPPEKFSEDPAGARQSIAGLPVTLAGLDVKMICTGHGGCTPPERTAAQLSDLVGRAAAGVP